MPSAGIHSSARGLSLWQCEDGQLPAQKSGQGQRQDQGNAVHVTTQCVISFPERRQRLLQHMCK